MSRRGDRRREKRRREKEARKAEKAATAIKSSRLRPKISFSDLLALLALPLAVAGMLVDNMWAVGGCLLLATVIPCVAIAAHIEVRRRNRLILCAIFVATGSGLFWFLDSEHSKRELAKNEGTLSPLAEARPTSRCNIPEDAFAVFAGSNVSWSRQRPSVLLSMAGEEIIAVDSAKDGTLRLRTLRLFDDKNEIVARVDSNQLWVHPSARKVRPDFGTLIVYDHRDREILNLRFLNPRTVSIRGVFRMAGRAPVIINDGWSNFGGVSMRAYCLPNTTKGIAID